MSEPTHKDLKRAGLVGKRGPSPDEGSRVMMLARKMARSSEHQDGRSDRDLERELGLGESGDTRQRARNIADAIIEYRKQESRRSAEEQDFLCELDKEGLSEDDVKALMAEHDPSGSCLLYTSPSPRDRG